MPFTSSLYLQASPVYVSEDSSCRGEACMVQDILHMKWIEFLRVQCYITGILLCAACTVKNQTQFLGVCRTATSLPSSLPSSGLPRSLLYSHRAVSGKLIRILSIRAPGVLSPNFVPRSYTKLNSTYRPRLISCQRRARSSLGVSLRRLRIGTYDGTNVSPRVFMNAKISSGVRGRMLVSGAKRL